MPNFLKFNKNKGFTLIELLVAATIISILATIAVASYSTATKNSRDSRRKADLESVRAALELYRSQVGTYVVRTAYTWVAISDLTELTSGGYINQLPSDPVPNITPAYQYKTWNNNRSYCLATRMEIIPTITQCSVLPSGGNYAVINP